MTKIKYIDAPDWYDLNAELNSNHLDRYDVDSTLFLSNYFSDSKFIEVNTSGSTGQPKIIQLEKSKMKASAKATLSYFQLVPGDSILLCLPVKFIAGKMIWVRALEGNLNVIIGIPSTNPIQNLTDKVKFAAMTPQQVAIAIDQNPEKFDLIETLIIGGGAVSEQLKNQLQTLSTVCYATYGMTETITHVAVKKLNGNDQNDLFVAIENISFSLGTKNNLVINAPHLSSHKIETNDIVELIDNKRFVWQGRLDFVVNSGGVKLFPEQIERKIELLINSPFFVWKEEDKILGERLILVIEGEEHTIPDLDSVLDKLESPKAIYFIKKFAYTENGKLDRNSTYLNLNR